jgi:hypothetical protein
MSAMRLMVALNHMASLAAARAMIIFKPCSQLRAKAHESLLGS